MYISNNSNIGMATVLQQQQQQQQNQNQKTCMKTLANGNGNDPTANHNKWRWQQQFENAALNMQYGMKPHQHTPSVQQIHPTSHIIAANNNPSNHNSSSCTAGGGNMTGTGGHASTPANNNVAGATPAAAEPDEDTEAQPEIDIMINNVVCSFSVRCHLNLRDIAQNGFNVEYRRENGMVTMKLRRPYTTASIWSSGRITCTGATSEDQAKIAARRYARCLEKLGFRVRFHNFRVVNVLGTCSMPWAIKIVNFSERYKKEASYEPELHPGVTYKLRYPKATLKIFSTGSITVTASCVANVQAAIEHIFPLVYEFRKERSPEEKLALLNKRREQNSVAITREVQEEADDKGNDNDDNEDIVVNTNLHSSSNSVVLSKFQRKRQSTSSTSDLVNHNKKRLLNGGYVRGGGGGNIHADDNDDEDADEPTEVEPTFRYTQYDDPEDLIEGPDDDDDEVEDDVL